MLFVYGVKVQGLERLAQLLKDENENRDDETSEVARLHEDWIGLDCYYLNDGEMVIGTSIMDVEDSGEFDVYKFLELQNECIIHAKVFGYAMVIRTFLGEDGDMKVYLVDVS